jgi:hypothetical protein
MPGASRWSPLLGLIFLALALAEAWSLHTTSPVFRLLIIVLAAFVAGVRLAPFFPGGAM